MPLLSSVPTTFVRPALLVLCTMACGAGAAVANAAGCALPLAHSPQAAPTQIVALGDDLVVDLMADASLGTVTVSLHHEASGTVFTTPALVSAEGTARATLYGALADADQRRLDHHLTVTGPGGAPLMRSFPLTVLVACDGAEQPYELIPGVATDGLLVTRALADALADLPPCALGDNLALLGESEDPELCTDARTLQVQLVLSGLSTPKPGPICQYAWQTVVDRIRKPWPRSSAALVSPDLSRTIALAGGLSSGAAGCFGLQGTSVAGEPNAWAFPALAPGDTGDTFRSGLTQVEQSILCIAGGPTCERPCGGEVETTLEYAGCAGSRAVACTPTSWAEGTAEHRWTLRLADHTVPLEGTLVTASAGPPQASATAIDESSDGYASETGPHRLPAPAEVALVGESRLAYRSSTPELEGTAYAFAESNTTYTMALRAMDATCPDVPDVWATLTTPALPLSRIALTGGLKMKRWWPDGEANFTGDGLEPPRPAICREIDPP